MQSKYLKLESSELSDAVNIELVCRAFLIPSKKYLIFTQLRKPHRQNATQYTNSESALRFRCHYHLEVREKRKKNQNEEMPSCISIY